MPHRLLLAANPVVLTYILLQSPHRQCLLLFIEPRGRPREVGEDEVRADGEEDGDDALNQEEPAPGAPPAHAIHVARDAGGYEAREGTSDKGARIEERRAEAELGSGVPAGEVVEAAGLVHGELGDKRPGTRRVHGGWEVTYEVCGLDET